MLLQDLPNIETLTAMSLLAGSFLGARYGMWVAAVAIIATDFVIGNEIIFLFTWSAWIAVAVASVLLKRWKAKPFKYTGAMFGAGVFSTLFFYTWTNFGVWLVGSMYAPTFEGLMQSYIAGLPFLKQQLLGNAVIVPIAALVASGIYVAVSQRVVNTTAQKVKA